MVLLIGTKRAHILTRKPRGDFNYVINFFRGMLKEMGYKGVRQEKDKHVNINGENYRKKFVYFHIE